MSLQFHMYPLLRAGKASTDPYLDAFKPQPMLRKIPVTRLQGRARFVWGSHQNKTRPRSNLAVTITSLLDLARAKRRLAVAGAEDFYSKEDFIDSVIYII